MDMIEPGMWIQVRSFKHDGSLHRSWDQGLVLDCLLYTSDAADEL